MLLILMKKNAIIFKSFFCSPPDNLLANSPPLSLSFSLHSVRPYYNKILKYPSSKFKFNFLSEETIKTPSGYG